MSPIEIPIPLDPPRRQTWIDMRNVDLRMLDDAALHLYRLRGEVIPTPPRISAILDSTNSFSVRITNGHVAIRNADLGALLNGYTFNYKGAPLRNLAIRIDGNEIVQTGTMHKGVDLHFEIHATPSLTPEGRIRLHPSKVRVLGINGEKLLHLFHMRLQSILDLRGSHGASVQGDDILLDPLQILPPPRIEGRVASIRVDSNALAMEFVRTADDTVFGRAVRPDTSVSNYVYFRGGMLRFGKLLMQDTDLQIIDADPHDPFDLYLERYNRQLVAGYSRNQPNLGLKVFFPDFLDLDRGALPVPKRR